MPGLLQLRRGAATGEAHRLLSLVLAAIIFVTWEEPLHRSVHLVAASLRFGSVGPRIEVLYWLARELVWWWLIASLAAIALCYMWRQPLIADALRRTREVFAQTPVMVTLAARANARMSAQPCRDRGQRRDVDPVARRLGD